jgi:hypothetical protein
MQKKKMKQKKNRERNIKKGGEIEMKKRKNVTPMK